MDNTDKALDIIYYVFDEWMRSGNFNYIDQYLRNVPIDYTEDIILIGYLTACLPAKSKIPYRKEFFKKVDESLTKRALNEPYLLYGLE